MQITLDIPEQYLVDRSPSEWGRHIKLYAALLMFAADELSAGAAAELAEVDRCTFVEACRRHAIPVIDYTPEELRAEVASACVLMEAADVDGSAGSRADRQITSRG